MFDLTGKVAIVTGGNSGIGLGMAQGLAEAGATVAIAARTEEKSQQVATEMEAAGGKAFAVVCDVTDSNSIEAMAATVVERCGRLPPVLRLVLRRAARGAHRGWGGGGDGALSCALLLPCCHAAR